MRNADCQEALERYVRAFDKCGIEEDSDEEGIGAMKNLTLNDYVTSKPQQDVKNIESQQRLAVLSYDQVCRLNDVMDEVVCIHGRGNFPTLEIRLRDLVNVVREKLEADTSSGGAGMRVRDIRLNGGAASHVLATESQPYNDLDLIFGVELSTIRNFDRVKSAVLSSLYDMLPDGVSRKRISTCSLKEAYVSKMVKVNSNNGGDRWSLISLGNSRGRGVELQIRRLHAQAVRVLRGALPPAEEADLNATPRGDTRGRAAQILQLASQELQTGASRLHQGTAEIHVLAVLHRLSGHHPAEGQAGELPVEPLRRARRGGPPPPVPDAPSRRGGGVHRMLDGTRTSADAPADQEPRLAGALPGPAAHDDTAAAAPHVRQWHRVRADHPDQLLLHVQPLVDAVLFVMCISLCERGRRQSPTSWPPSTEVRNVTQASRVTVKTNHSEITAGTGAGNVLVKWGGFFDDLKGGRNRATF
ncbi:hypothetical protein NQ317_018184 [Molorchus minor]|uniref:polynucleotide adenylyltransferase n=1 Tax=Molorchus minor TaxID=1323400 RepID=A0ABQ9JYD8_9CUCU|nr:hypothetical protein NQ317_018184 [Molorchus minor]